jgi:glutamate-1-semialdehyde 2,1-aminomutase
MDQIAPDGPVYQAGTLSGNPLAMAAGIATLKILQKPGFYSSLNDKAEACAARLRAIGEQSGIAVQFNGVGSLMTAFFTDQPVLDFESAMSADTDRYGKHYRNMLSQGIYLAPSQFELAFISAAHTPEALEKLEKMTEWSFKKIAEK